MKIRHVIVAVLTLCFSPASGEEAPQISIVNSATPTSALLAKPGTYLGETFVFEEMHQGNVKVQVGVWEAGKGKLILDDFPFTEYVLMISGSVVVTEKNGTSITFKEGDTFVIPKGWSGIWDVQQRMKKQIVRIGNPDP